MDLNFIGNAMLFTFLIALQLGFLPDGSSSGSGGSEDDPPEDDPLYDPSAYGREVTGTDGDDDFDSDIEGDNLAYFLGLGDDTLDASDLDDYAEGGAGNDDLMMRLGDDIALGGDGNDTVDGGFGNDILYGDAGDDVVNGSKGDDEVYGGDGNDTLTGSDGDDLLEGGAGDDILSGDIIGNPGAAADGVDTLDGGDGNDTLQLSAADTGTGGAGSDLFEVYETGDTGNQVAITDFTEGEDAIAVFYTETFDPVTGDPLTPNVEITPNADSTAATLSLDGVVIADIAGGQDLTPDDVALIPRP